MTLDATKLYYWLPKQDLYLQNFLCTAKENLNMKIVYYRCGQLEQIGSAFCKETVCFC